MLDTAGLWFYSALVSLVFGATVYEALVVHPARSHKPPESFVAFMGTPVGRMNLTAFWIPVAPLLALSALASVAALAHVVRSSATVQKGHDDNWGTGGTEP